LYVNSQPDIACRALNVQTAATVDGDLAAVGFTLNINVTFTVVSTQVREKIFSALRGKYRETYWSETQSQQFSMYRLEAEGVTCMSM
jgi:hypothetical protein